MEKYRNLTGPAVHNKSLVSESIEWHSKHGVPISFPVHRWSSIEHINMMSEARILFEEGAISLSEYDSWMLENTDIGRWGIYEGQLVPLDCPMNDGLDEAEYRGKKVTLNKPFRGGGSKKFSVYVKNEKGNVIKLGFGQSGMRIKTHSPERVKSFLARHNCDNPGPRWKARWWSCNLHRYKKQLGLNFKGRW